VETMTQHTAPVFPMPRTGSPLDPPMQYDRFRDEGPLKKVRMWDGRFAWLVTARDEVRAVLSSPHFSADPSKPGYPFLTPSRAATVKSYKTFITMDPPDHTRFRRMLTRDFTYKRMEELRPRVEQLVDAMIEEMIAKGPPADFVQALALRLPVTVISLLAGVPLADDAKLVRWSNQRLDLSVNAEISESAGQQMLNYFDELLKKKEQDPGEATDMLGRLVVEQIRPGHLDRLGAVHMINLLYFAGHETTANQIGLGALHFLLQPEQMHKLTANPELVKNAVEEMLRFDTPPHYNACRVATADVTIGGQTIRAGEGVYALLSAANRDPNAFSDPGKFDIERKNASEQMAFSFGLHQCIGQPLARLELQTVFSRLFQRLPGLKLAIPFEEIQFKRDFYVYGLQALPVTW
jgi:cytochrome P450